jgi:hypothetical protein
MKLLILSSFVLASCASVPLLVGALAPVIADVLVEAVQGAALPKKQKANYLDSAAVGMRTQQSTARTAEVVHSWTTPEFNHVAIVAEEEAAKTHASPEVMAEAFNIAAEKLRH